MLESARNTLAGMSFRGLIVDARWLPFADGSFDLIIANHMLYHVPDIAQALSEIRRVLVPGGRLYAATIGIDHMREMFELVGKAPATEPLTSRFTLENGAAQFKAAFATVECRINPNELVVTEIQPVIDYLESTALEDRLTRQQFERAHGIVSSAIDRPIRSLSHSKVDRRFYCAITRLVRENGKSTRIPSGRNFYAHRRTGRALIRDMN